MHSVETCWPFGPYPSSCSWAPLATSGCRIPFQPPLCCVRGWASISESCNCIQWQGCLAFRGASPHSFVFLQLNNTLCSAFPSPWVRIFLQHHLIMQLYIFPIQETVCPHQHQLSEVSTLILKWFSPVWLRPAHFRKQQRHYFLSLISQRGLAPKENPPKLWFPIYIFKKSKRKIYEVIGNWDKKHKITNMWILLLLSSTIKGWKTPSWDFCSYTETSVFVIASLLTSRRILIQMGSNEICRLTAWSSMGRAGSGGGRGSSPVPLGSSALVQVDAHPVTGWLSVTAVTAAVSWRWEGEMPRNGGRRQQWGGEGGKIRAWVREEGAAQTELEENFLDLGGRGETL